MCERVFSAPYWCHAKAAEPGIVFGRENMGVIQAVGSAVTTLKGDVRVVMPFNVACGVCKNCQRGFTGFCTIIR